MGTTYKSAYYIPNTIFSLPLVIVILLLTSCLSQKELGNGEKIGYYVFIQDGKNTQELKTESMDSVYVFIQNTYPRFCSDLEYNLSKSPAYAELAFKHEVYIEKMRVSNNSKYKRLKWKK